MKGVKRAYQEAEELIEKEIIKKGQEGTRKDKEGQKRTKKDKEGQIVPKFKETRIRLPESIFELAKELGVDPKYIAIYGEMVIRIELLKEKIKKPTG